MTWRGFAVHPDDVLFFRDGKPSTMGSDHSLRSLFPPYPSTLYGAIRTRRLVDFQVPLTGSLRTSWPTLDRDLRAEVGEWQAFGSLHLRGPWLLQEGQVLRPAPADLRVVPAPAQAGEVLPRVGSAVRLRPGRLPGGGSHPLVPLLPDGNAPSRADLTSAASWYLTPTGFTSWRQGGVPDQGEWIHRDALWSFEPRTGVGLLDEERQAREGYLFTFGFVRLQPGVTLGFEASGTALEPSGGIRLGGERKTASLAPGPGWPVPPALGPTEGEPLLALTLATPLASATGAYPPGFGPDELRGTLAGEAVELVAAAVGQSVPLGGWDLAANAPKPLKRGLPAGSVFVFSVDDSPGNLASFAARLDGTSLAPAGSPDALQGFGLVTAGLTRFLPQPAS